MTTLAAAEQQGHKVALLFIDFDEFKRVNDTFGHTFGDAVLRRIARRLSKLVSETVRVYRMGGDEFTLIANGITDDGQVQELAERVSSKFRFPMSIGAQRILLHCSIGAAVYPDHGRRAETLLQRTDEAMYAAKGNGGRCCHLFTAHSLQDGGDQLLNRTEALTQALHRQEFELHYNRGSTRRPNPSQG